MPRKNRNLKNFANSRVAEAIKIAVDLTIQKFLSDDSLKEWEYPSSYTAAERAYIHTEARKYNLKSKSRGKGAGRYLTIYKREGSAIMQVDASLNLTPSSRTVLLGLVNKHPLTIKERQDCLPPFERTKDTYQDAKENSRALGRLYGGVPQVPPMVTNKTFAQFRASLPIYSMRDTILHTISDHQVTIISGATGSGKTTQVPQYLLEWHERLGRPCKVICAVPRRISAVTVSDRVAAERGEKLGHIVGYQVRLEGRFSPYTALTYCTSGVLLRTLLSNGENALASVTHIILDEVHERDRLNDFILIVLREALNKFRSLRLVLMSATIDSKQFSSYFNNCPVISVAGKSYDVKEYFLEDVLKQTGYMVTELEKLKLNLNKKRAQAVELDKWTKAVTEKGEPPDLVQSSEEIPKESESTCKEMDVALCEAWSTGSESAFSQMFYLIQSENISVDYQHSETGVSGLMVAAARGVLPAVEQFLSLGASLTLRASNNFTALDLARSFGQQEIEDVFQAYLLAYGSHELMLESKKPDKQLSEADRELIDLYHTTFDDTVAIDYKLIMALITQIHQEPNRGTILVFLPGYDDIINMKELILQDERKLSQKLKIIILMLHSNMQTGDQKLVFKPAPQGCRKVILSTNIAETSVTMEDVVYVIDSGKVKEKTFNAISGVSQLCTVWISRSCAAQRRGRAGRTQPGICYHMFSSTRYDAMPEYTIPEILRIPLPELCLCAKQLAPPNTSIVDFLSKAIDPPSATVCRSAVTLLKSIDALDTWEDLTDLGHHLVDLPVEPRYGKMLVYASILKCLDPVLTIVCCLSYKDLFVLPPAGIKRKEVSMERIKFSAESLSDHMALLRVFQGWQEAKRQGRDRQFCAEHYVSGASLDIILGTRSQVLAQLRASGFIRVKGPGDIKSVNTNSDNWAVVKAAIVAGLYPNIARVDREHNVLRTQREAKVGLHASSVLHSCGTSKGKNVAQNLPTDWVVYEELTRVGRISQIRTATVVSPAAIALFAGPSKIPLDALSDGNPQGSEDSDSEEEETGPEETAVLKLDDWLLFRCDSESGQLALQLRLKWHSLVVRKLRNCQKLLSPADEFIVNTLVRVLSAEEQACGLTQPAGVGRRPYLFNSDLPSIGNRYGELLRSATPTSGGGLAPSESSGSRNVSPASSSSKSSFERVNGAGNSSKNTDMERISPTSAFGSADTARVNASSNNGTPIRYFIIKSGQVKNIDSSLNLKAWCFSASTHSKILHAYKGGKGVVLIFSIHGTGQFQGYARLCGDTPVDGAPEALGFMGPNNYSLPVEWVRRSSVPHLATRHLGNHFADNCRNFRDGQEVESQVGEALCQMMDVGGAWPSQNGHLMNAGSSGMVRPRAPHHHGSHHGQHRNIFHNSNYKM